MTSSPIQSAGEGTAFASVIGTPFQSTSFPSIAILPSGRWICSFRAAPEKGKCPGETAQLTWSDDEGKHWSSPTSPWAAVTVSGRPGNLRTAYCTPVGGTEVVAAIAWVDQSQPDLAFFDSETSSLLEMRIFFSRSTDEGVTWSEPELLPAPPFDQAIPVTGPILARPDGTWICPYETNKPYGGTGDWKHTSRFLFSPDRGRTWPDSTVVSSDPANQLFYWDQRPGLSATGELLNLFWTYDNGAGKYRNIHAARSEDGGLTWSAFWDTGLPGQPAAPVHLGGAEWLMVYIDRENSPVIKAVFSSDHGRNWSSEPFLVASSQLSTQTTEKTSMSDAWDEMLAFSMGFPATARCANGDVLVVYYGGPTTDQTSIHWRRLKLSPRQIP